MTDATSRPEWRRSCASSACVEVAKVGDRYLVRNSKNPDVTLSFTEDEWASFTRGVQQGVFRF